MRLNEKITRQPEDICQENHVMELIRIINGTKQLRK